MRYNGGGFIPDNMVALLSRPLLHYWVTKAGVPALYAKSGLDHVEHGEAHGMKIADDYTANRYHKPGDEYDAGWDLTGVMQDLHSLYRVGQELAGSEVWKM